MENFSHFCSGEARPVVVEEKPVVETKDVVDTETVDKPVDLPVVLPDPVEVPVVPKTVIYAPPCPQCH